MPNDSKDENKSVQKALELSRKGEVAAALNSLQYCRESEALGLRFHFAMFLEKFDEALEVSTLALNADSNPLEKSTWHLRRARSQLFVVEEKGTSSKKEVQASARVDLMKVISLRAADDHIREAQRILLQMVKSA